MSSRTFAVKVSEEHLNTFEQKAKDAGYKTTDLVREMISAFNDGRMTIELTDEKKVLFGLKDKE